MLLPQLAGTLVDVPDSGMPPRMEMWRKAQEALTPEEIAAAGPNSFGKDRGLLMRTRPAGLCVTLYGSRKSTQSSRVDDGFLLHVDCGR